MQQIPIKLPEKIPFPCLRNFHRYRPSISDGLISTDGSFQISFRKIHKELDKTCSTGKVHKGISKIILQKITERILKGKIKK